MYEAIVISASITDNLSSRIFTKYITFPQDENQRTRWDYLEIEELTVLISFSVYFVITLETGQTILTGIDGFRCFASGFGSVSIIPAPGLNIIANPIANPIMGSVIALIVQSFFCYRIWVIRKSVWWLSAMIVVVTTWWALAKGTSCIFSKTDVSVRSQWYRQLVESLVGSKLVLRYRSN